VKRNADNPPAGRELDAAVAERVMGWKEVQHAGQGDDYRGKRPDKAGRLRAAKVPGFSTDPAAVPLIESRMKQLGLWEKYCAELSKLTRAKGVPSGWATPEQASRAALKVAGTRRLSAVK
jgi:hypothetical protein